MDIKRLHDELLALTGMIRSRGLQGVAEGHINWFGDELQINVEAKERYDENGFWSSEKSFVGAPDDAPALLASARAWAASIPDEEQRAAELMIRKLNELADKLPKGGSDISSAAFEELGKLLLAKAGRISQNGLESPERISQLPRTV